MNKGFIYKASVEELDLVRRVKGFYESLPESAGDDWKRLSGLRVDGNTILIDFTAFQEDH